MHFTLSQKFYTKCENFQKILCTLKVQMAVQGKIKVNSEEVNLNLSLLGGQSFRWRRVINKNKATEWRGIVHGVFWILQQKPNSISYTVYQPDDVDANNSENSGDFYKQLLSKYLRLDFNLMEHLRKWRLAHEHFNEISPNIQGVRVLYQDPLENIISFICSQNNNIKRISSMIDWLCNRYGRKIVQFENRDVYSFPSLESLQENLNELEESLRKAKFGYRAKFIAASIRKISEFGGYKWFDQLKSLPYAQAREELIKLPGIGYKVADCVCLMSLNHLESVPIDTHIFKIAQTKYMPQLGKVKNVTPKLYDEIGEHFRKVYGEYAGWAQAILFCSQLPQVYNNENDGS